MRRLPILLALAAGGALAQIQASPQQNVLTTTVSPDGGTLVWYVDVRGNDKNTCRAAFTDGGSNGPCLTPQAAINKVPKVLRSGAVVSIDAGTYGCFYVSGFSCDPSFTTASGGLMIDGLGAMQTSTLATGSATGTFTSSTAGSGSTFGTGVDTGAAWTVNDLTGRFVLAAGQRRVISSNTATAITIVGTWTSPGAVAYTIQDPGVVINTTCQATATPLGVAGAGAAIWVTDNTCSSRSGLIAIRGIRTTNAAVSRGAISFNSPAGLIVTLSQLRNVGDTELMVGSGSGTLSFPGGLGGPGNALATDVDMLQDDTTSNAAVNINSGIFTATRVLIRGCHTGVQVFGGAARAVITNLDVQACKGPSLFAAAGDISAVSGSHFACDGPSRTGLVAGFASVGQNSKPAFLSITDGTMSMCGVGLNVIGTGAVADISALSGSVATTGFLVQSGGALTYSKSGTTFTAPTEVSIDTGDTVGTFAAGVANACRGPTTTNSLSRVCAR